jgi:integrase
MATLKLLLQSKSENAPIYLRLSNGRKNPILYRKTGLSINYTDWSATTGLPKQTTPNNKKLSTRLQKLNIFVGEKLNDVDLENETVNGDWLKFQIDLFFERITENKKSELITDAIQDIIDNAETRKNAKGGLGISKSRVNSYTSLKNIITEYQGTKKYKVKEVNVNFAKDFLKYLINVKKYQVSYATKKIADLKTVCFDAEVNGIPVHFQLKKIDSTKPTNENIIYLSNAELTNIENTELPTDALKNVRKWLLLGCNIGQRGGDLLSINESNFVNRNGLQVIELRQQKTNKNVTIPVLETTKQILNTGLPYKISIQKFNEHVKRVCELAEINDIIKGGVIEVTKEGEGNKHKRKINGNYPKWQLIGSHVCRRSFASNLYGILPTPLIMQITAHSTEKMLLNYIGKQGLDYAQQIADFYTRQAQKEKKETNLTIVKKAN